MIRTDGVSGCSLFVRTDIDGKPLNIKVLILVMGE